jgi:hypothetical protein
VDSVSAYHNIGVSGHTVMESNLDAIRVLSQSDASMVKMKDAIGHRRGKNVEQFGAMEIVIGGAEVALACVGQRLASKHKPIIPATDDYCARPHSEAAERFFESEPMEDSRRVRTYLDTGADLAQFGGLFEDLDLEARARKRQRSRKAANPSSNYDDSHIRQSLQPAPPACARALR